MCKCSKLLECSSCFWKIRNATCKFKISFKSSESLKRSWNDGAAVKMTSTSLLYNGQFKLSHVTLCLDDYILV